MAMFKYQPQVTTGPFGTVVGAIFDKDCRMVEVVELEGQRYVFVPEGTNVPEQPTEIQWQEVEVTEHLAARLKQASPRYRAVADDIQHRIRQRYSAEDEAAFARLGTAAALGLHELTEKEKQEFKAYNDYVEEVRQWGRELRAALGL